MVWEGAFVEAGMTVVFVEWITLLVDVLSVSTSEGFFKVCHMLSLTGLLLGLNEPKAEMLTALFFFHNLFGFTVFCVVDFVRREPVR